MDVRTTENCQKYREAKQFVNEYEKEYNSILHKKYDINVRIWVERTIINYGIQRLKEYPTFSHLNGRLERRKKELISLLKEKYSL